jgi:hypothetical protein
MFGRFIVLAITFLMVSATALIGQGLTCTEDRCCYPNGRCFPRVVRPETELHRAPLEAPVPEGEHRRSAPAEELPAAPPLRPAPQSPSNSGQARPNLGPSEREGPAGAPTSGIPGSVAAAPAPRILETGYARLGSVGEEKSGYGLYSYVLITSPSNKSVALLNEIFKVVPNVQNAGALPKNINILYIPFLKEKENEFADAARSGNTLGARYAESFYNFQMARTILDHLCNPPADVLSQLCAGDLSRGPFIFTYEKPASTFQPVQAPYLFVDLRDVHEHAFAEFVSAYQQQVKSEDVNSGERLNTLRLKFLNLALNAADFVKPVPEALADVIHSAKP